jgi:ATP-dependent exoDNAse (exonuclease V) beta subunit
VPSGASSKAASYDVIWWDPQILKLGAVPSFSIRQQELLEEGDPKLLEEDLKTYNNWCKQRAADLERGSEPSLILRTATELSSLTLFCDVPVPDAQVLELDKEEGRPKGPRFGALVHASIATVPLQAGSSEIYDAVALQARILGASEDEVPAACRLIEGVMGHDLLRQAREAYARGKCRRETPITLRGVGGTLIEGNVDLAFEEDGEWKVIDFKTDQQLKAGLEKYRIQVGLYAMAISLATGQQATPILLSI